MSTATHYENANFLRELAESLPRIWPNGTPARTELLQRLADEELAQHSTANGYAPCGSGQGRHPPHADHG